MKDTAMVWKYANAYVRYFQKFLIALAIQKIF